MPHVVIQGDASLDVFFDEFAPFEERRGSTILKVKDFFINREARIALLDCVVVEGRPKTFLILLDKHGDRLTVRLYPPTDPEKSDGVRRLLALVAHKIVSRFESCDYGMTNLTDFLIRND